MEFGVFDHLDSAQDDVAGFFENRLRLAELYDRTGFHAYHVAEHHGTPLGFATSPGIFLSAVAQRTRHLRFGPLVYILPLYHPLRLLDEIAMLDALSGGRLELGVGKGISPYELQFFGLDPAAAAERFEETLSVIRQGFAQKSLNHEGKQFRFHDVPVHLQPVQKPHPPMWYGVIRPDSAKWAAENRMNIISGLGGTAETRQIADAYWATWRNAGGTDTPKVGLMRQIVVADTDEEAQAIARRSHRRFRESFLYLWQRYSDPMGEMLLPEDYHQVEASGSALAGSPDRVRAVLKQQIAEAGGVNYLLCRFALGDQTFAETVRSVELFAREVMPALR